MSATVVDYAHTAGAERNRAVKVQRLVDAAVAAGVSTCELRLSYPLRDELRRHLLHEAGVRSASPTTWSAVFAVLDERLLAAGTSRCQRCGAPVLAAAAQTAPVLLLDPLPHPAGEVALQRSPAGALVQARPLATTVPETERPAHPGQLWRPHVRCCPGSARVEQLHGRRRRCPVCNYWLAWWVDDPTYTTHPTCEGGTTP